MLAQAYVETGGVDLKLYVAGGRVWGARRPSPLLASQAEGRPAAVTAELRELALACAARFDLRLAGIDVLESPAGPLVVDVNEFPDYTGVDEAPATIAGAVLAEIEATACAR
jgi:ribosomal protein S6--L-glutamate ligase